MIVTAVTKMAMQVTLYAYVAVRYNAVTERLHCCSFPAYHSTERHTDSLQWIASYNRQMSSCRGRYRLHNRAGTSAGVTPTGVTGWMRHCSVLQLCSVNSGIATQSGFLHLRGPVQSSISPHSPVQSYLKATVSSTSHPLIPVQNFL